ncbi:tyrosine-protein kinase family protein [uncultured Winogradskyella sp.]|uniref:GumC family protein n=1 Tax=uncultured Winogradskyella sp. TaxID=395353 RepID=UPI002637EE2C|nr:tyrosine-protein kinase family protein [uncultured Winogradskyella sp.]
MKTSNVDIKQTIGLFFSYWKWILLSVVIALILGFTYLRYTAYEYKAVATIKIQDEKESKKLPSLESLSSEGLFAQGTDKVKDEIKVIQSRAIAEKIIKTLDLNIRYFADGKIKEQEYYKNSPVKINFLASDSVIDQLKTAINIKIKSQTEYILFKGKERSLLDREDSEGKVYAFGDKVNTRYGGYVITPNLGPDGLIIGTNLKITVSPLRKLIDQYSGSIGIGTEKGSSVLKLELKQTVAQKAVDYLNQLILEYNRDVLKDKEEVVKVTTDFINKRLDQVSKELSQVESNAELLQQQNNITALSSQTDLNLQTKKQLEQQINSTSTNIQTIKYLEEEVNDNSKISDLLPEININDSNTAQIIRNYNELVAQRDRILGNSSEKNPVVIQLNNQINGLKDNLKNSLQSIKKTSELTLNNLTSESRRVSGQLYTAPSKARKFRGIQRQQDIKESLYLYLLEKREESAIRFGMYSPNAKIIDSAHSSYLPVAPNKTVIYLASFILGCMIPIGFIYLIDLLDVKIYTKKDLEDLLDDIPFLGDIPKTSKKEKLVKKVDYSPKAEAFRIVRSNIDFILKDVKGRAKKLFITSTKAQEGKSHTSTNLASSISFSNKSVLLIEMDIRVPKILDYLGFKEKPEKGLSDYIADKTIKPQDVVFKHKENPFLDIIPSGTIPPNPSELLMSDRVEELFNYFETKYDYIIADTSAVGLVSDTLLIAKFADMFVYVASANNVDKRQLAHVAQPLYNENRIPNMTMLLNGVKKGRKGYGYGYGYGADPAQKKKWYNFFSNSK